MLNRLFSRLGLLERSIDAAWLRNEVIAENIANVDTPGYKRKTVAFEEYLNGALDKSAAGGSRTGGKSLPLGANPKDLKITVLEDASNTTMRIDGNNVDIDTEMAEMAKNTIKYNTLIQSLSAEFRKLKHVISEGRR